MHMQDGRERPEADGPPAEDDELVTASVVAHYYKVTPSTVSRWRLKRLIPFVTLPSGNRFRYPRRLVQDGARRRDWWPQQDPE